jgi:hypothetical protein
MQTLSLSILFTLLGCDDGIIDKTCEDTEQGCGDSVTSNDTADVDVTFDAVVPEYGSDVGGSLIELRVQGLLAEPKVLFGGIEATVEGFDDTTVTIRTPPFDLGGPDLKIVDVEVVYGLGETLRLAEAFTYHKDRGDDQQMEVRLTRTAEAFTVSVSNFENGYGGWELFLPGRDECVPSIEELNVDHMAPPQAGTSIVMGNILNGVETAITPNESDVDLSIPGPDELYSLDLRIDIGTPIDHRISEGVQGPATMELVTPSAGENDFINRNQIFTWELPAETSDDSFVFIEGVQASGGQIFCIAADDGFFRTDLTQWSSFEPGEDTQVNIRRLQTEVHTLPWNNAAFLVTSISAASTSGLGASAE